MTLFSKLFGPSKYDILMKKFDQLENEKKAVEAEKQALEAEKQAIEDAKTPKEIATAAGEPWVDVIKTTFEDPKNPGAGYFELDWNEPFVKQLIEAGYSGRTDDEIVDMWFNDLCRGVVGDKT